MRIGNYRFRRCCRALSRRHIMELWTCIYGELVRYRRKQERSLILESRLGKRDYIVELRSKRNEGSCDLHCYFNALVLHKYSILENFPI